MASKNQQQQQPLEEDDAPLRTATNNNTEGLPPTSATATITSTSDTLRRKRTVTFQDEIVFDSDNGTSIRVLINRIIDQGTFRSVYVARDARISTSCCDKRQKQQRQPQQLYALKKIDCCGDDTNDADAVRSMVQQCKREAEIHRLLQDHKNVMPLLGFKLVQQESSSALTVCCCYMLFPYIPLSLRHDITVRRLLEDTLESKRRPYTETEVLSLFAGIVRAVEAMHDTAAGGYSHRDICVDNVLLRTNDKSKKKKKGRQRYSAIVGTTTTPILTDFGSVGPLTVYLETSSDVIHAKHDVERYTTVAYRAPELFFLGNNSNGNADVSNETATTTVVEYGPLPRSLHYDHADIWSLGCLLFAMLYGLSPFEIEWQISLVAGAEAEATARFVECTPDRVLLGPIPFPPDGSAADRRYGEDIKDVIRWMLAKESSERPSISQVSKRVVTLLDGCTS